MCPACCRRRPHGRGVGAAATAVGVLATTACGGGGDEEFPSDTIETIIPYAVGGSTDAGVRQTASVAEKTCGTEILASNQTGGAVAVGFTATANADPDGYTVGATATDVTYLQELGFTDIGPDDLKGVMRYGPDPHVYFVPAASPGRGHGRSPAGRRGRGNHRGRLQRHRLGPPPRRRGARPGGAVEDPDERVQVLDECLHEVIESGRFVSPMAQQNLDLFHLPPEELEAYLPEMSEQYTEATREVGIVGG